MDDRRYRDAQAGADFKVLAAQTKNGLIFRGVMETADGFDFPGAGNNTLPGPDDIYVSHRNSQVRLRTETPSAANSSAERRRTYFRSLR